MDPKFKEYANELKVGTAQVYTKTGLTATQAGGLRLPAPTCHPGGTAPPDPPKTPRYPRAPVLVYT